MNCASECEGSCAECGAVNRPVRLARVDYLSVATDVGESAIAVDRPLPG